MLEETSGGLQPNRPLKAGCSEMLRTLPSLVLTSSEDGDCTSSLRNLCHCSTVRTGRKVCLMSSRDLSWFN